MKIRYFIAAAFTAFALQSCNGCGHTQENHAHEHEELDHDHCDEDHEHESHEGHGHGDNVAVFSNEMAAKVGLETVQCRLEPMGQTIRTMAMVMPAQTDEFVITAKSEGVAVIPPSGLIAGQSVRRGQTLLAIDGGSMVDNSLEVRYREAQAAMEQAKQEYERKQALAVDGIVSESELLASKTEFEKADAMFSSLNRGWSQGRLAVTSPVDGYLQNVLVCNGDHVEAGRQLATVCRNGSQLLEAQVQSRYFGLLEDIAGANIRVPETGQTWSLEQLGGSLKSYAKSLEPGSPLLPVVFQVNHTAGLLPGSYVEMFIRLRGRNQVVQVPASALIEEMGEYFVYVWLELDEYEKRLVRIGQTDGMNVEILSGLEAGETVVSKGAVLVKLSQSSGKLDAHAGHVH